MLIFQYIHELKAFLTEEGRVPKDTGNLQEHGFKVRNIGVRTVGMTYGDTVQVPYAKMLNEGYIHFSGRPMNKHKGWLDRGINEFAEQKARELGGTVSYD